MSIHSMHWRTGLIIILLLAIVSCADDGSRNTASSILSGPPDANEPVTPNNPQSAHPSNFADATQIHAQITRATIGESTVVEFVVADSDNIAIGDLTVDSIRLTIAKLVPGSNGDSDAWQSYINQIEEADGIGPGEVDQIQATYERNGTLTNLGNGQYSYTFSHDIQSITEPIAIAYNPEQTHRIAIQFDGAYANPTYTWLPLTGATEGIHTMDIAATNSCNRCHDPLGIHGGNRREISYCVTCHNPGSIDANSANTVDFKVMVHKIHQGHNLPSVSAGGSYQIWGFRDSKHDYSELALPMDVRNCTACHAGSATGSDSEILTNQGDNWAERPTIEACGSCHDDVNFVDHFEGQNDNGKCAECHTQSGEPESIVDAHRIPVIEAAREYSFNILDITQTAPGEFPQIMFSISNPQDASLYDIDNAEPWTSTEDGASRLAVTLAWDSDDYGNAGNGSDTASSISINALADSTANGDGSYTVVSTVAIPDGSEEPAVIGSGAVTIEGHPAVTINNNKERIPVTNAITYFSINEVDGEANTRRQVVSLSQCLNCHKTLSLHGSNRTDNLETCVTCHNPRNTDRDVRNKATTPPTDGKVEESLDFKTMVHGIHAAAMRENPLQIVGFGGFSTHVFDEEHVHYPGNLSNCLACHTEESYQLPLADNVLATTVNTGNDHQDDSDDMFASPISAVCASCHDGEEVGAHMVREGGTFSATKVEIEAETIETCSVCHGSGKKADVKAVHDPHEIP